MQEFSSISVSAYEPADLTNQLNEQSAAGWSVVSIVTTGSTVTAYLSRGASGAADSANAAASSSDWSASTESVDASTVAADDGIVAAAYTTEAVSNEAVPTEFVTADSVGYAVVDNAGDVVAEEASWVAGTDSATGFTDAAQSASAAVSTDNSDPTPHVGTPSQSDEASHAVASAADHASHAASTAGDHASHAASTAGDHASHAASTATDHASHAASTAGDQAAQAGTVVSSEVGAAAAVSSVAPPGWYTDPSGRFELRYWDGGQWTEHVSRNSQQFTDPPVA